MPELPEVETVRRYLESELIDEIIIDVFLSNKKSLRNADEQTLGSIVGQKITSFDRKAKHLIMNMTDSYLIMHLRMEGKFFIFKDKKELESKTNRFHDILIIQTKEKYILFQDFRRFATIDYFKNDCSLSENPILLKVADEPFIISKNLFFERVSKKRTAIKTTILDQSIISGIGNIYADEILFDKKIHPERISSSLTKEETDSIIESAKSILNKSIKYNGTTIKSYTSSLGVQGNYQQFLTVHQKVGHGCPRHPGQPILKIKVGGRGTFFCPLCQKK